MKPAASEHIQTTVAAISSGVPILPIGSSAITLARASALRPAKRSIIGVSMYPGQTALIRTFFAAYSRAAKRVSPKACGGTRVEAQSDPSPDVHGDIDAAATPSPEVNRMH